MIHLAAAAAAATVAALALLPEAGAQQPAPADPAPAWLEWRDTRGSTFGCHDGGRWGVEADRPVSGTGLSEPRWDQPFRWRAWLQLRMVHDVETAYDYRIHRPASRAGLRF